MKLDQDWIKYLSAVKMAKEAEAKVDIAIFNFRHFKDREDLLWQALKQKLDHPESSSPKK